MSVTQINGATQIQSGSITHTQLNSSAGITLGQLAVGSTIILSGGSVSMAASLNMGSNTITNGATPVNPTDFVIKSYVDSAIQGLTTKPTARVATTGALAACTYSNGSSGVGATLTGNANNTQLTIDGVTYAVGDLLLIKNQVSGFQNGLYTVTQLPDSSHPFVFTRHIDMDTALEFDGSLVPVDNEGTTNANTLWLANNPGTFIVGTTNVSFTQLAAPTAYVGGNGISISGTTISVLDGNGLGFSGSNLVVVATDASLTVGSSGVGVTVGTPGQVYVATTTSGICTATTLSGDVSSVTGAGAVTLDITKIPKFTRTVIRETPTPATDGSTTVFTLAHTPISGTERIYMNGVEQDAGAGNDYTISGATITYLSAPASTDKLRVNYWY